MSPLIARKRTVHGGAPVIAGTRIPVSVLVPFTFEKNGLQRARQEYPLLTERQIVAAWEYAEKMIFESVHDTPAKV